MSRGLPLGIQIAQCRSYLQTLGPNVGIICIHGSLGFMFFLRFKFQDEVGSGSEPIGRVQG